MSQWIKKQTLVHFSPLPIPCKQIGTTTTAKEQQFIPLSSHYFMQQKNNHGNIQAQHLSAGAFRQQEQHSRCMGALSARVTLSRVDAVAFCQQEQHSVPSALGNCSAG
jgi:hypothetical protein